MPISTYLLIIYGVNFKTAIAITHKMDWYTDSKVPVKLTYNINPEATQKVKGYLNFKL